MVNGDTVVEPNETFTVNLPSPTGATIADDQGAPAPSSTTTERRCRRCRSATSPMTEGNSGTNDRDLHRDPLGRQRQRPSPSTTPRPTAPPPPGTDYVAQSGTLTFAAGQTTQDHRRRTVNGDTIVEPNETFIGQPDQPGRRHPRRLHKVSPPSPTTTSAAGAQPVTWTALMGVTASGNSLTDIAATGDERGAASTQRITSGDGYVEFTASETTTNRLLGLSNGNTDASYPDVDFGIALGSGGPIYVFEKGVNRGSFGTYQSGNVFRVAVVGGIVKYSKNGTVFYTSTQTQTYPLLVDTWLYTLGATLNSVVIQGQ